MIRWACVNDRGTIGMMCSLLSTRQWTRRLTTREMHILRAPSCASGTRASRLRAVREVVRSLLAKKGVAVVVERGARKASAHREPWHRGRRRSHGHSPQGFPTILSCVASLIRKTTLYSPGHYGMLVSEKLYQNLIQPTGVDIDP